MLWLSALVSCSEYNIDSKPPRPKPEKEEEEPEEEEPIADAGPDQEMQPLQDVQLDGTASYDPNDLEIVAVKWELVERPASSNAELTSDDVPRPTFWADFAGDYVFSLTVQNEDGVWDSTPDEVVITVLPLDGFYVELSWDQALDLDLHLMDESAELFSNGDCNYCNKTPSWGSPGSADDPSLDWDDINGHGPETITIDSPSDGTFYIGVQYYDPDTPNRETEATVNIYIGGVLAETFVGTLSSRGDLWQVARLDWPDASITEMDNIVSTNTFSCF